MVKKFYIEDAVDGYAVKYSESAPEGFSEISDPLEIEKQYRRLYKKRAKDLRSEGHQFISIIK